MRRLAVILVVVLGVAGCGSDDPASPAAGGTPSAPDRLAMSELRNAFAAEKVFYVDNQSYTESLADIRAIEPALTYAVGTQPAQNRTIYVKVAGEQLYLSARSRTGRCFYIRDTGAGQAAFAVGTACGPAEGQQYVASW